MEQESKSKKQSFFNPLGLLAIALTISTALGTTVVFFYIFFRPHNIIRQADVSMHKVSFPELRKVTALGRLEPQGEIIRLYAPSSASERVRVDKLLVKEGEKVKAGQTIAILNNRDRLQASSGEAKEQIEVAQAQMNQLKAGAKSGEIAAQQDIVARLEEELRGQIATQQSTITRLKAELENAQVEYQRYQLLYQQGAISASNVDSKYLTLKTSQEKLNEAEANFARTIKTLQKQISESKATLNRIKEVRPIDLKVAQAQVKRALATFLRTQAELDLAYVRTPEDGRILKIHTRQGEAISDKGIVELGKVEQMYVSAEVYETDISKLHLGQKSTITSPAFAGSLMGTVEQIGWQIGKQDILNTDPAAEQDARVVEVKIRINPSDSQRVKRLTNLQVIVTIDV
jgi:HlyD family secretion protein